MLELVGWSAAVLTQIFWIPNIAKIVRTRDVEGYSLLGWCVMFLGISLFLVYFLFRGDPVAIVTNGFGTAGSGLTVFCILRWRRRGSAPHGAAAPSVMAMPEPALVEPAAD